VITANAPEMRKVEGAACVLDKPTALPQLWAALCSLLSQ
jgi:hypothetical protein